MNISTTDAQGLYTKMLVDVYKQKSNPTSFLRSFFPEKVTPTLELSVEVQRGFEKVAVDVTRGTDGNRNQFSKSTEKLFIPPYYREWMDATQLSLYDRLYGATSVSDAVFVSYINSVADALMEMQSKIERAQEVQCAQVLTTGIVTYGGANANLKIDFKRKAASLVDGGGATYFAANNDPFAEFEKGCTFLRQVGKASGGTFNAILGSTALTNLLANTKFQSRQNLFNMALDNVVAPQRNAVGQTFHGIITAGAYKVQLWSYPQYYDNASGVQTSYIDPKQVILIPEAPKFVFAYAATPQLITPQSTPVMGKFTINQYIDQRGKANIIDVESAGLAIPTAVDTIYTFKAVA